MPGDGAGHPGGPHRPAAARGQAAAPGGRRHRQGCAVAAAPAIAERRSTRCAAALAHLQAAEFLYETRLFPDLEYTFKHALTHEVAYGSLLHDRRRALHARIVDAIERLAPERLAEHVSGSPTTRCAGSCGRRRSAISVRRGSKATARAAYREAIGYLRAGAGGAQPSPRRGGRRRSWPIDLRIELPERTRSARRVRRACGEHLREAEGLARTLGDPRRLARIATFMVSQCRATGDYDGAVRFGQEARASRAPSAIARSRCWPRPCWA